MRIVFFGSAEIGFPIIEALMASPHDELVGVVTQPDRPVGRKLCLAPCPVKAFAQEKGLSVFSPEKVGSVESLDRLCSWKADLFVVVAYGQYMPQSVLALPPCRSINLHPSLLPKYRGSSPIQWSLANGDSMTGVTILYVGEKMDAGDILCQREIPVCAQDNALTMEPVLARAGADLLMSAVDQIRCGTASAVAQDDEAATEVRKLTKEDGRLDWALPATVLNNRIRGFVAWPGCFYETERGRVKVVRAQVESGSGIPGEILDLSGCGPLIAAGEGALRLVEVQPAGKRAMDGSAYLRGHSFHIGDLLAEK